MTIDLKDKLLGTNPKTRHIREALLFLFMQERHLLVKELVLLFKDAPESLPVVKKAIEKMEVQNEKK